MRPKLNISKITPPRLPGILIRPRLIESLKKNKDKRLTLLLGQAAQGKSTLGAAYVGTLGMPLAWANLTGRESDPANLFYLIAASLQEALDDVDLEPLLSYPSVNTGPRLEIPLYRGWIDSLLECVTGPLQIVLDGLDRLQPDAPSFQLLQVLIEELPPDIHLLALSREMPPLRIQDLKVKQQVFVITNEDLAFTLEETGSFLRDCRKISLRSDQIKSIHHLTEGWVGGLVLLSEILLRMPEDSREHYLASDAPRRFKGEVFRYFAEEIFSSELEETQNLLVECSILKTIDPGFLRHFTRVKNAQGVLEDFSARNLFVMLVYDEKKGEVFRFHQLFGEFLREKFETEREERERCALFFRAGTLYEKRGDLEQAVEFYLLCRAYDKAARSLERIGMHLWRSGRIADLARWLRELPKGLVLQRPWLLFYLSLARRCKEVEENIGALKDAFDLFEKAGDAGGRMGSLALLIETTLARGSDLIPMAELIESAESLLGDADKKTVFRGKAYLRCALGIAYSLRGGDPRKGFLACIRAKTEAKRIGDKVLLLNAIVGALIGLIYLGEFSHAQALSKKGIRVARKTGIRELEMLLAKELCELALFRGDFEEAAEKVRFLKEGLERYGFQFFGAATHYSEMRLNIYAGNYMGLADIGRSLLHFSRATGNRFGEAMYFLLMGIGCYRQGDFRKSRGLTYRAMKAFSSGQTYSEFHVYLGRLLMGLICLHLRDYQRAGDLLPEVLEYFIRIKSAVYTTECHVAQALWKWHHSQFDDSASHLGAAFRIAEERGYKRLTILSDKDLARACGLVFELKVTAAENYAGCLLVEHLTDMAGPELESLKQDTRREIRKKAQPIMKAMHRAKVPRIRIRALGEFRIDRDGISMAENDWEGNQPKALLKAILSRGSGKISADLIMDDLWPESGSPIKNLKAALHRLRKSLEPEMDSAFGSSYVHLKENRLYLDKDLCEVDAYQFMSLVEEGEAEEKKGNEKDALSLYTRAVAFYGGDFLPEELYNDRVNTMREALRRKYVEFHLKLARDCENRRALNKAIRHYKKALEEDPLLESAYQRAMILYDTRGKKNEALRVYEKCKKALREGLDTIPDDLTKSIYLKIQQH